MTFEEVMTELEKLGTEQTRKTYARHGVRRSMFGVSYANLNVLRKKIGIDHDLAERLWAAGNHDAGVLATMIADPARVDTAFVDRWRASLDNSAITDALSKLAAKGNLPREQIDFWCASDDDWTGQLAWSLVGAVAMNGAGVPDEYFQNKLETIEREIHGRKNRTRYAMNCTLIAIGLRNEALKQQALAAAQRIGHVEVDHGDTDCKTPDAVEYIAYAFARRLGGKQTRARAKTKPAKAAKKAKPARAAKKKKARAAKRKSPARAKKKAPARSKKKRPAKAKRKAKRSAPKRRTKAAHRGARR